MKKLFSTLTLAALLGVASSQAAFVVSKPSENAEVVVLNEKNNDSVQETTKTEISNAETAKESAALEGSVGGKNQWVALALAVLGLWFPLGLARFYLKKKHAVTQLLLTFPGFILILPYLASWIWNIVDLVRILSGDLKPEGGDYSTKM